MDQPNRCVVYLCFVLLAACSSPETGGDEGLDGVTTDLIIEGDSAPSDAVVVEDANLTPDVPTGPCEGKPDGVACDDEDPCTLQDSCQAGTCVGGSNNPCDAEGGCRIGYCDSEVGCLYEDAADGTTCNVACFGEASCTAGACQADADSAVVCPDPDAPCVDQLGCDQTTGECTVEIYKPEGVSCDSDENVCSLESCDGQGACEATGETDDCAGETANNPCWTWACTPKAGCVQTVFAEGVNCDDGNACTFSDTCSKNEFDQQGCLGAQLPMDDGNPCTEDLCLEGKITHTPIENLPCPPAYGCSDLGLCDGTGACITGEACECDVDSDCPQPESLCAGTAYCDKSGAEPSCEILPGTEVTCESPADDCLVAECNPGTGFCEELPAPEGTLCDDEDVCTTVEVCVQGACTPQTSLTCDDGLFCNGVETCDAQAGCQVGAPPVVDDDVSCTLDSCDELLDELTHTLSDALCADDDLCNGHEFCSATDGCLQSDPVDCSVYAGTCTSTECNPLTGACDLALAPETACEDGDPSTANDQCSDDGQCAGTPIACEDGPCILSVETDGSGCIYEWQPVNTSCDDDDLNTATDVCDGQGNCTGASLDCEPTQCELTSTSNGATCVAEFKPLGTGCDDLQAATVLDTCDGQGTCSGTPTICGDELQEGLEECDDGNTVTEACLYGAQECTVCDADCKLVNGVLAGYCGDDVVQLEWGEQCDGHCGLIVAGGLAYAAVREDGSVATWGSLENGGDSSQVTAQLSQGVQSVTSTQRSFAAIKHDGSVVTWGTGDLAASSGGDSSQVAAALSGGVAKVYSSFRAFAALKTDGSVVTWGQPGYGSDSSSVAMEISEGVVSIFSTEGAFAALKVDGSVVTWGHAPHGGESSVHDYNGSSWEISDVSEGLLSGVDTVVSNTEAFAALKNDGSVVTWGTGSSGGKSTNVAASLNTGVTKIVSTKQAFAALKNDGSVVCWGNSELEDIGQALSSGVEALYTAGEAFVARKEDGGFTVWMKSSALDFTSDVKAVYGNNYTVAALKNDGSVSTWGEPGNGGDPSVTTEDIAGGVSNDLSSEVVEIFATTSAFAALKENGSVVTWGYGDAGGDSSIVSGYLASGVREIYSNESSFVAVKTDGSVVTWGKANIGGDSSSIQPLNLCEEDSCEATPDCGVCSGPNCDLCVSSDCITASFWHTCALNTAREAVCWGDIEMGKTSPPEGQFTTISAGYGHTCALNTENEAVCWGALSTAAPADPTPGPGQNSPPEGSLTALVSGWYHICWLGMEGLAACLGSDSAGQSSPPEGAFTAITAGEHHTCGLNTLSEAVCWGWDEYGQSSSPAGSFTSITAGSRHTCALKTTGEAVCWGEDEAGQSSPPEGQFTAVSAGYRHTCALNTLGEAVCWGEDEAGQSSPPAGKFTAIKAGGGHSCAINNQGEVICWGSDEFGESSPPENFPYP
jgi:alpha-tubulin suppressor-like RCC1 family protein